MGLFRRGAIGLCLGLLCFVAQAETYRCTKDGRILITNSPCASIGAIDRNPNPVRSTQNIPAQAPAPPPPPVKALPVIISEPPPQVRRQPTASPPVRPKTPVAPKPPPSPATPWYLWPLLLVVIFVLAKKGTKKRWKKTANTSFQVEPKIQEEEVLPYKPAPLMSSYELEFFGRIRRALPEMVIFPQVPLAAFIRIDKRRAGREFFQNSYRWQNRIGQQRVDFLVCDPTTMNPVVAIELDDPSHDNNDARGRDDKKDKSLRDAGVRLIRWRVEMMPVESDIRASVML